METTANRIVSVFLITGAALGTITLYRFAACSRAELFATLWVGYSWCVVSWSCMAGRLLIKGPYRKPAKARLSEVSCLDEFVL